MRDSPSVTAQARLSGMLPERFLTAKSKNQGKAMMFRTALATLLVATVAHASTPDNVSSRLMIHIPKSLRQEDGYDHREALFGVPPYGGSIAQNVYYADSDLCDPNVDTTGGYPSNNGDPWESPYILMVDRGDCTFVKKVRNAQKAGASGVVIADNKCLCSDRVCKDQTGIKDECESSEPIMADDGSGSDISIPSFLMFKHDADRVIGVLKDETPVQLEMAWSLPNPDGRVEYDLWSVPTDTVSKTFFSKWKDIAISLGKSAYFTPHMYIYDGIRTHCVGTGGENFCYNLCTNKGRYCATDPDNDLDKGISGADVVKESLRRLCIWKEYGSEDGIGQPWWNYIEQFEKRCNSADYFMNDKCVKDCYKHAKIDNSKIEQCMEDSGGLEKDGFNSLLDAEIEAQSERGVVVLPTAFVNTAAIRGQLSANTIFHAICAGFADGTTPSICEKCSSCNDSAACVTDGICTHTGTIPGTVSTHTFATSLLMVTAIVGGAAYWHYQKTREDMREQVRGILAEYMPLEDQDEGSSPMDFARGGNTKPLTS